ncbi:hypothetical protein [Spongiibacter sp.]|uniref:hypothetical protein n=1 Tax=Spongiibacter sp. TaxID=2024860 RepID=UPI00257DC481|nr:hypothetical protein [Spongiibacter sp.]|tara:strand:- start:473 stop:805 length:333 start_codon:yes stop_codon:yes gene_type:complete
MKNIFIVLMLWLFSGHAVSAPGSVSGAIQSVTVKETGYLIVALTSSHSNPEGCDQVSRVAIEAGHPGRAEIMSVLLSALAMNKPVSFWIMGCYNAYGKSYPIAMTATISK